MKKIVITQYRKEHSGSTIGAWLYHYGVDFKGGTYHSYSVETTSEGMGEIMRVFKEAGYEVEYVKGWEQTEIVSSEIKSFSGTPQDWIKQRDNL